MQQQTLRIASHLFVSSIFFTTFVQTSIKLSALNERPNKFFTWAEAIVTAPADVKPATTGVDTKSIKKPTKV